MNYNLRKLFAALVVPFICLAMLAGCGGGGGGGGGAIPPGKTPSGEDNPVANITSPSGNILINEGDSVDFQGSATEGTSPYTYLWSFPGGSPSSSTSQNPADVVFSAEGEYIVNLTVTDSDGHKASDTATITVVKPKDAYMYHKGVHVHSTSYLTDSMWMTEHTEPFAAGSSLNAESEYRYNIAPAMDWSGEFTDVPARRIERIDTDILVLTETWGQSGIVTWNNELIGEITVSSVSYAIQTGEHAGTWFSKASWEILTVEDDRYVGLMYMTCDDFNDTETEVWGRVEGDIQGLYHADNVTPSVFSQVEIISINDLTNTLTYSIQWDTIASVAESEYAGNDLYIQDDVSWQASGVGAYVSGDMEFAGDILYLPFFNAGKFTGSWSLEATSDPGLSGSGDMFSYLYLCQEDSIIVPLVEGLTDEGAEYILNDNALDVNPTIAEEFSSTVPVGHVISQTPQAGQQEEINSSVSLTISKPTADWKCVSAGLEHTLAIDNDGRLWAWGNNDYGQLGTGDTISSLGPVQIGSDTDWQQVSAGRMHSLAIKNGHLWAWGSNDNYQLGRADITGMSTSPIPVDENKQWSAIAAGGRHSLAIDADSDLWAWGDNTSGQLGDGTRINRSAPISIGDPDQYRWSAIAAGLVHSLGIADREGKVYAWGSNEFGQLGIGDSYENAVTPQQVHPDWFEIDSMLTTPISISAGGSHSMVITKQGNDILALFAWGYNGYGQLGLGGYSDDPQYVPLRVGTDNDWSAVSAGGDHTLAKKTNGTFLAWGDNTFGQLGTGDTDNANAPVEIFSDTGCSSFSAGGSHSANIRNDEDNTLWTWGLNSSGQLGNRTYKDKLEQDRI